MMGIVDNICVVLCVSCRFSLTDGKDHVTSLRKLFTVDVGNICISVHRFLSRWLVKTVIM